ncbi:hypothetical protein GCM10027516_34810 [Niabella aquatica]
MVKILQEIDEEDQRYRRETEKLVNKGSNDTLAFILLGKKTSVADSMNQIKVLKLLDSMGWPDKKVIGAEGSRTIWAVLQHADPVVQEKYFPVVKKAVADLKAEPADAAYLEDRILVSKGLKQKYGTQLSVTIGSTKSYMLPVEKPESVDSLRNTVYLLPLKYYLKNKFGMDWDLNTYYKELPEAEKVLEKHRKRYLLSKEK